MPQVHVILPLFCHAFILVLGLPLGLALGWRQRLEGGGTLTRLGLVVLAGGLACGLPVWIGWWLTPPEPAKPEPLFMGLLLALLCFVWFVWFLRPPVRLPGRAAGPLPALQDRRVLERVGGLAVALGVRPPPVRVLHSAGGQAPTLGYAGGLQAPTLIVSDGLLHRLEPGERDAILAHELAHLATGSLWWYALQGCLAGALALPAILVTPARVTLGLACLLFVGLRRIVSRRFELACDVRAGRVAGYRETAGALDKIHATHPLHEEGVAGFLVTASATHPARARRQEALWQDAPADLRAQLPRDRRALWRARVGAWLALLLWLAALGAGVWLGRDEAHADAVAAGLAGLSLAPTLLQLVVLLPQLRRTGRRQHRRPVRRWLTVAGLLGLAVGLLAGVGSGPPPTVPWPAYLCAGSSVLLICLWLTGRARQRLRRAVGAAFLRRDFAGALALGEARPDVVARDPSLQHDLAVARAAAGDVDGAVRALEPLAATPQRFPQAALTLALYRLDRDPEQALRHAEAARVALPHDASPLAVAAEALHRLGRLDEAATRAAAARALLPRDGSLDAIAAHIEVTRGNLSEARQLLEQAMQKSPGDLKGLLVRAKLAVAIGAPEEARQAVAELRTAHEANPFSLLGGQLRALEQRLPRLGSEAGAHE
jgi:Zn-dependent protease with chaperone function/Flp pilus assembly protein TadD